MVVIDIYLGLCALIFCWFMLLGIHDFLFEPPKNVFESNSFRNKRFWVEALWCSVPIVNLAVVAIFLYILIIGYREAQR